MGSASGGTYRRRLEVLMTWEWPISYGWSLPIPTDYDPERRASSRSTNVLEPIRAAHPTITIQPAVLEGHPAPLLVKVPDGADLLVVGSRGHGEFAGMLLGSVSEHCVTNAHCPCSWFARGLSGRALS